MDKTSRKSITLPDTLWAAITEFRFEQRIGTEAEAVRRLLLTGIAESNQRRANDAE